ncbi:MAG: 23S rRNA pseudouridine1911/1915/1917 synthase [Saprospiraceae bacterium]|jgi:23S rRNA pseudouridine1911/1915/1917 synthase
MLDIKGLQIIYEDNHLIAVNKAPRMLVQGDETGDVPLSEYVKQYIKLRYKKPGDVFLGTIHRLDRPVSGVVIFARTTKALTRMNKLFQERKVEKTYWAVVAERPEPINGTLTDYILKDREKNIAKAYDKLGNRTKAAKESELSYELIKAIGSIHLLKVTPKTGRPHQIRVQLAKIGCPIWGDVKYGFNKPNQDSSIHLHCKKLAFIHPIKLERIEIEANPPATQLWNELDMER